MPRLTLSSNLKSRKQLKQTSSAFVECEPEKRNEKVNFGERLMSVCARDRGAILFGLLSSISGVRRTKGSKTSRVLQREHITLPFIKGR